MRTKILRALIFMLFAMSLWACSDENNDDATLIAIAVTPANSSIAVNNTRQFTATGTYSDNSTQVITNSVTWTSSDTGIAVISNAGVVTAVAVGSTAIKAALGSISGTAPLTVTFPTSASVKLSTVGSLPAGKKIGTIDLILTLAPGVTLKSTTSPSEPDAGVVTATGVATNSLIVANYSAPTSTLPGNVRIGVISAAGFGTGEFATVNGDIAAGNNPKAADFSLAGFAVTDSETNSSPLSGLTPGLSVDLR